MRLLLIEDNPQLAHWLSKMLADEGFLVEHAPDGETAEAILHDARYDVVLLDLNLPGMSGKALLRRMREHANETPVLVLTATGDVGEKVICLSAGADDYVVKPFAMKELEARIRALYRRGRLQHGDLLHVADLMLDPVKYTVERAGQPLTLTRAGFVLLEALMRKSPNLVRHNDLAHALWGDGPGDIATLHTHLSVLRSTIDRPFKNHLLHTVHGFGYRISEHADA